MTRAFLVVSLLLVGAQTASAEQAALPGDFSAADQYVESVPTSGGPHAPVGKGKGVPLPPGISGRLTGRDGSLNQVATSSRFGAPRKRLHHSHIHSPGVPRAAVTALDGSGGNTVWLLLGLLLATGAVVGTAGHRQYNQRNTQSGG